VSSVVLFTDYNSGGYCRRRGLRGGNLLVWMDGIQGRHSLDRAHYLGYIDRFWTA
jgi:hypothetical protein